MAAPFGRAPTFAQYLSWLVECGGGHRNVIVDGEAAIDLTTAEGQMTTIVGIEADERLAPTMIAYLDRRLAVTSPWHVERSHYTVGDPTASPGRTASATSTHSPALGRR